MAKHLLDHQFCLNVQAPEKNPAIYYDNHKDAPIGFALKVTPAGSKKWILRYYVQGKERRMTLEKGFPSWGPRRARKEARDLRIMVTSGTDLLAEKAAAKQAKIDARNAHKAKEHLNLGALMLAYIEQLKSLGKNSYRDVEWSVRKHIERANPSVWNTPADEIGMPVFRDLVGNVKQNGNWREAQKLRSYLRSAYTASIAAHGDPDSVPALRKFDIQSNPVADVAVPKKPPEATRQGRAGKQPRKSLSVDELRCYWRRINDLPNPEGAILRLHLLTGGQRLRQLCRLTTNDLDGDTVTIWDRKGRRSEPREHVVPLLPDATAALDVIGGGPWLVSMDGGKTPARPFKDVSVAISAVSGAMLEAEEIDAVFTGKLIRSTVRTQLRKHGIRASTLDLLLSHNLGSIGSRHYEDEEELRPLKTHALKTLIDLLNEAPSDVVPIWKETG